MATMSSITDTSPSTPSAAPTTSHAPIRPAARAMGSSAASSWESTKDGCPRTTSSPKLSRYAGSVLSSLPSRAALGCSWWCTASMCDCSASAVRSSAALSSRAPAAPSADHLSPRALTRLMSLRQPQYSPP